MSSPSLSSLFPVEGGCVCKHIRYKLLTPPLITACCYCTWCQRETGSAFILNAMVEADRVVPLNENEPFAVATATHSGNGHDIYRCPKCYVAVWSDYGSTGVLKWVKVGTLDHPEACPPGVRIFTENQQPWLLSYNADPDIPVFKQYYDEEKVWSKESVARLKALKEGLKEKGKD